VERLTRALARCLRQGWQIAPVESGWRLQHPEVAFEVFLQETHDWFCLMRPLTTAELATLAPDGQPFQLHQHMLLRNRDLFMTRYGLDNEGQPLLLADVPQHNASSFLLEVALEAISKTRSDLETVALAKNSMAAHEGESGLSPETLLQYVNGIKLQMWKWGRRIAKPQVWHLQYLNQMRRFDIFFTSTRNWSYFELPLIEERTLEAHGLDYVTEMHTYHIFLQYLLRLNYHFYMAKIALNQENQVLLLLEVPTSALDLPLFQLIASTLSTYVDRYGQEILVMSLLEPHQNLVSILELSRSFHQQSSIYHRSGGK